MPFIILSVTVEIGWSSGDNAGNESEVATNMAPPVENVDEREARPSPLAKDLQQSGRLAARVRRTGVQASAAEKHQQLLFEREADAESLCILEAATAKAMDQDSLAVLMHHTAVLEAKNRHGAGLCGEESSWQWVGHFQRACKSLSSNAAAPFTTPASVKRALATTAGRMKGLNKMPHSYEPSFPTTSTVRNELQAETLPETLRKLQYSRVASGEEPENLKSAESGHSSAATSDLFVAIPLLGGSKRAMDSAYIREQVESVFEWMEKLQQEEADDERTGDGSPSPAVQDANDTCAVQLIHREDEEGTPIGEDGREYVAGGSPRTAIGFITQADDDVHGSDASEAGVAVQSSYASAAAIGQDSDGQHGGRATGPEDDKGCGKPQEVVPQEQEALLLPYQGGGNGAEGDWEMP